MYAILSTRLTIDLQTPDQWVSQFCEAVGQPQWAENMQDISPFNDPDGHHIPASCCFRTLYQPLDRLRSQGSLQGLLLPAECHVPQVNLEDVSVRISRFE